MKRGEGVYVTKRFQPVHQQDKLGGAMLLRLGRANGSFSILCQGLDSKLKFAVTVVFHSQIATPIMSV